MIVEIQPLLGYRMISLIQAWLHEKKFRARLCLSVAAIALGTGYTQSRSLIISLCQEGVDGFGNVKLFEQPLVFFETHQGLRSSNEVQLLETSRARSASGIASGCTVSSNRSTREGIMER